MPRNAPGAENPFNGPAAQPVQPPYPEMPAAAPNFAAPAPEEGAGTDNSTTGEFRLLSDGGTFDQGSPAPEAVPADDMWATVPGAQAERPELHGPEDDDMWATDPLARPVHYPEGTPPRPVTAPAVPADGEAAPAAAAAQPDGETKRKRMRNVTGKKWLASAALLGVIGFGGNVITDQIVDQDGIFATDSRETGEAAMEVQQYTDYVEYGAGGMLAITGLAIAGRSIRASGRFVSGTYRKLRPKKNNIESESSETES